MFAGLRGERFCCRHGELSHCSVCSHPLGGLARNWGLFSGLHWFGAWVYWQFNPLLHRLCYPSPLPALCSVPAVPPVLLGVPEGLWSEGWDLHSAAWGLTWHPVSALFPFLERLLGHAVHLGEVDPRSEQIAAENC